MSSYLFIQLTFSECSPYTVPDNEYTSMTETDKMFSHYIHVCVCVCISIYANTYVCVLICIFTYIHKMGTTVLFKLYLLLVVRRPFKILSHFKNEVNEVKNIDLINH